MSVIFQVVLFFVYLVVGCILSAPYTFLANGNLDNFFVTAWVAPVAAIFLFVVYPIARSHRVKRSKWGGGFFWVLVAYFCSPILLNGVSLLLKWAGYEVAGHHVFESRFLGLLIAPILLVICGEIANGLVNLRRYFSGRATTPSSSTPPSGLNKTSRGKR